MAKKSVEKRHSETAFFAALIRAVLYKNYNNSKFGPDSLAEYFLPAFVKFFIKFKRVRTKFQAKNDKLTPGMFVYMLARTAFFDDAFKDALNAEIPQIVLLGAGYDTRPYRFAGSKNATRIFELDISTTQERKKTCLKKHRIDVPEGLTLVPIDFNKESVGAVLETAGYRNDLQTLFLWEGVSYYLESDSVDRMLEFVQQSGVEDSVIAFDYAISTTEDNIDNYYGAKIFHETWRKHRPNELFKSAVADGEIGGFLEDRGLRLIQHLDPEEIEKTYLLNDDGSLVDRVNGLFRFVKAAPKNQS